MKVLIIRKTRLLYGYIRSMPDVFHRSVRSYIMSRIRGKDTTPELVVRRFLHSQGYRFRLHVRHLPGRPDIVLPKHKTVVFVHGCFWHGHAVCQRGRRPQTNSAFWNEKLDNNRRRDRKAARLLARLGWKRIVVWECRMKGDWQTPLLRKLAA